MLYVPADPPTFDPAVVVSPGVKAARLETPVVPVGSAPSVSSVTAICWRTFCVSTSGEAPVTVMVSSTLPTRRSPFTVAVNPAVSTIASRLTVLNPVSVNVTV